MIFARRTHGISYPTSAIRDRTPSISPWLHGSGDSPTAISSADRPLITSTLPAGSGVVQRRPDRDQRERPMSRWRRSLSARAWLAQRTLLAAAFGAALLAAGIPT